MQDLPFQFREFRSLKGKVIHQSLLAENKAYDRFIDFCRVKGSAGADIY